MPPPAHPPPRAPAPRAPVPLAPTALALSPDGTATLTLSARVTAAQPLSVALPRTGVRALRATDSRPGARPVAHRPAAAADAPRGRDAAVRQWLTACVGRRVSFKAKERAVAGRLVGVHAPQVRVGGDSAEDDDDDDDDDDDGSGYGGGGRAAPRGDRERAGLSVAIEEDGGKGVSVHCIPELSGCVVSVGDNGDDGDEVCETPFEDMAHTLLEADGEGEGVVTVEVVLESEQLPYTISHSLALHDAVLRGTEQKGADLSSRIVVHNPLPYDLHDVDVYVSIREPSETPPRDPDRTPTVGSEAWLFPLQMTDTTEMLDVSKTTVHKAFRHFHHFSGRESHTRAARTFKVATQASLGRGEEATFPFPFGTYKVDALYGCLTQRGGKTSNCIAVTNRDERSIESGELSISCGGALSYTSSVSMLAPGETELVDLGDKGCVMVSGAKTTKVVGETLIDMVTTRTVALKKEMYTLERMLLLNATGVPVPVFVCLESTNDEELRTRRELTLQKIDNSIGTIGDGSLVPMKRDLMGTTRVKLIANPHERVTLKIDETSFVPSEETLTIACTLAKIEVYERSGNSAELIEQLRALRQAKRATEKADNVCKAMTRAIQKLDRTIDGDDGGDELESVMDSIEERSELLDLLEEKLIVYEKTTNEYADASEKLFETMHSKP